MTIFKKVLHYIKNIMTIILVVLAGFLMIVKFMGDTPSIFGYTMYYIVSPSMEPTLEVGDVILSKSVKDPSTLEIGDVVTYMGEVDSFKDKLVTHQIIDIEEDENGNLIFTTQGTKEGAAIDPKIRADQIKSKMCFEIPFIGIVLKVINTPIGFMILLILPLAVCLFGEIVNLVKILLGKDEEGDEEDDEDTK